MRRGPAGVVLAPALAVAAAAAVHVLAALHLDTRAPTDGEARLAAAVYAASGGAVGPVPLPLPDLLAARQLAAVTALVPPGTWAVWATVQVGALACGLLTAVLLWPVLRRLGCGGGPTALGIALVGVTPPAVALHSAVTGAAVAVPWLLLAAVLAGRGWLRRVAAGGAVVVAALTAPLVGAAVLALAAHAVVDGTVSRRPGRVVRVGVGIVMAAAAVALAVAAVGPRAARGDRGTARGSRGWSPSLAAGVVLVVAGWRVRWVRPLLSPAVLLLVGAARPGSGAHGRRPGGAAVPGGGAGRGRRGARRPGAGMAAVAPAGPRRRCGRGRDRAAAPGARPRRRARAVAPARAGWTSRCHPAPPCTPTRWTGPS